jgi:hypothetical protein
MNKCFLRFVVFEVVFLFLLSACASGPGPEVNPAQELIFSELATSGNADLNSQTGQITYHDDKGTDAVTGLQYYVSRRIVMTKVDDPTKQSSVSKTGVGQINIGNTRNTFTIEDSTPGVVLPPEDDNGKIHAYRDDSGRLVLEVSFETENNYTINFVQDDINPQSYFHIVYTNPTEHEIQYGDVIYKVEWADLTDAERKKADMQKLTYYSQDPFLLIEIHINREQQENAKKASGRRIGTNTKAKGENKPFWKFW